MSTALIVDDSLIDQRLAGHTLEKGLGLKIIYAANGREAIRAIREEPPDIVVTDMQMPEMDGLELVEAVRREYPTMPVVLMTAVGSEELAAAALRGGASSYVPKRYLRDDLVKVVQHQLMLADFAQGSPVIHCVQEIRTDFVLRNESDQIAPVVRYLQDELLRVGMFCETTIMNVGLALEEAITNAMQHGNLELGSFAADAGGGSLAAAWQRRCREPPYCDRRIHITASLTPREARYTVRDEGDGFEVSMLPDLSDPTNLEQCRGRGLVLIHAFMDQVIHGQSGREITMIKRRGEDA